MGLAIVSSFDIRSVSNLVRKGFLVERRQVFPTGIDALDRILPDGGLPEGRITEIAGPRAAGKLSLALAIAALALERGFPVALIDASASVQPQPWIHPALEALLLVRGGGSSAALKAADTLIRTRAFPLLVLDLPGRAHLPPSALVRLSREARTVSCVLLLLTESLPWRAGGLDPLASLRLETRRLKDGRTTVAIEKSKLGNLTAQVVLDLGKNRDHDSR